MRAKFLLGAVFAPALLFSAAPQLTYATYLGGRGAEGGGYVATDSAGNYYVAVTTDSPNYPVLSGPLPGGTDIVVTKFSSRNTVLYSTVIGGTDKESVYNAVADASGNLYVAFSTRSYDFPKPAGSTLAAALPGAGVFKLSPAGALLAVAMFRELANRAADTGVYALTLDSNNDVWIGGETSGFVEQGGALQDGVAGLQGDGFVAHLNNSLNKILYFTYLGTRESLDRVSAIVADSTGNIYLSGIAGAASFKTGPSAPFTGKGAFLMKLDPVNNQIVYADYLSSAGSSWGLALDGASVWVTATSDANFVPTPDAAQKTFGGHTLMRFNAADGKLLYATFLGGTPSASTIDQIFSLAIDRSAGRLFLFGDSNTANFPTTPDALQKTKTQTADSAILVVFDTQGRLVYSSYLGGSNGFGIGASLAVDSSGNVVCAGTTTATNFPTTAGSAQTAPGGGANDIFLARIEFATQTSTVNPALASNAIQNAASFRGGAVVPGEVVTLYPSNAGPESLVPASLTADRRIATLIGGTRVLFDDVPAPMVYAVKGQVSAVVPYGVQGKASTRVVVEYNGVKTAPVEIPVSGTSPGIFTIASGIGQAAVVNENGSINSAQLPADRGSIIIFFLTGEGQTNPPGVDGRLNEFSRLEDFPRPVLTPEVRIGGQTAEILYAGGAPGFLAGLMQFNVRVPTAAPAGASVALAVSIGGVAGQSGVTLAVR